MYWKLVRMRRSELRMSKSKVRITRIKVNRINHSPVLFSEGQDGGVLKLRN